MSASVPALHGDQPCVDILLATYNGRAYIDLQIASILAQSHANFRLLIRDDHSPDGTGERLQDWARRDERISIVRDDRGRLGAAGNFLELLRRAEAPYVMFADQDDIWLASKIARSLGAVQAIEQDDPARPVLAVCDAASFEEGAGFISNTTQRARPTRLEDFLFLNGGLYGCCMMLNAPLVALVAGRQVSFCAQHDHLVSLVAICFGRVVYLDDRLMFYRRHRANVSGGPVSSRRRLLDFLGKRTPLISRPHLRGVRSFARAFRTELRPRERVTLARFMGFLRRPRWQSAWVVLKVPFRIHGRRSVLLAKLLLRPLTSAS